jgi:hypothetical protein
MKSATSRHPGLNKLTVGASRSRIIATIDRQGYNLFNQRQFGLKVLGCFLIEIPPKRNSF